LLEGEPGVGKTRLLQEFARLVRARGIACAVGRFYDPSHHPSLQRILSLLDEIDPGQLRAGLQALKTQPRLGDSAIGFGDPRADLFFELSRGVERLLEGGPLVLLIDDIQWADPETLLFVDHLAAQEQSGLLLLLTLRSTNSPAESKALSSLRSRAQVLKLRGLSREGSLALFESAAGPIREDEAEYLQVLTHGNPLFISELAVHLAGSGLLPRLTLPEAVARERIPRSITAFLDRLLESLTEEQHAVLEVASCIGGSFKQVMLEELLMIEPETVEDALSLAWDMLIISRTDGPEAGEFEFAHPLLKERVYRQMTPARRRAIHCSLALLGEDEPALFTPQQLALHAARGFLGADRAKALALCRFAAEDAEDQQAFEVASEFWRLALSRVSLRRPDERAELFRHLAFAYRACDNWAQARAAMQEALEIFRQLGNRRLALEAGSFLAEIARFQMQLDDCIDLCQQVVDEADEFPELKLRTLALMGGALVVNRQVERGLAVLESAIQDSGGASKISPDIAYWTSLGLSANVQYDAAERWCEIGLKAALSSQDATYTALLAGQTFLFAVTRLDGNAASKAVATLQRIPSQHDIIATVRINYAETLLQAYNGQWYKAKGLSERWLREVRLASRFQRATAELMLAESQSALGDQEQAISLADTAIPFLERQTILASLHRARFMVRSGNTAAASSYVAEVGDRFARGRQLGIRLVMADLVGSLGPPSLAQDLIQGLAEESLLPLFAIYAPISTRRVLGKLQASTGQFSDAFRSFDTAIQELSRGGAFYELAMTLLNYAAARATRRRRGDMAKAGDLLRQAEEIFSELALPLPKEEMSWATELGQKPERTFALTTRELEVLSLVATGKSNRDIAVSLNVTPFTVARHLESILAKTQTRNRMEATQIAQQEGLLDHG